MTIDKTNYSDKTGLPPGTLVYVGTQRDEDVSINKMAFSPSHFSESTLKSNEICDVPKNNALTTWFDIYGVYDTQLIGEIGECFELDKLVLEDIVNTTGRPKIEDHGNYLYLSFKVVTLDKIDQSLRSEQISLVLGENWLLSFHETKIDVFESFRNRIRQAKGIVRTRKEDYLFYRILDTVVDHYFIVTEFINTELDVLEEKILNDPESIDNQDVYKLKKLIGELKKVVVPVREAISSIIRLDSDLVADDTKKYFRDVYEHSVQIIETIDQQREMVNDLLNMYMSALSNKMNEVMKVLTIFASIFIPLTFIAGIYGMNFDLIPELKWKYGYFITWGVMIAVTLALLFYFKRKKWL